MALQAGVGPRRRPWSGFRTAPGAASCAPRGQGLWGPGRQLGVALGGEGDGTGAAGGSTRAARFMPVASAVNYTDFYGSVAGQPLQIFANGSDTNIDIRLVPKGTGRVRFGTLTASADAPVSGYIEIVDSGGTVRKLAVIT